MVLQEDDVFGNPVKALVPDGAIKENLNVVEEGVIKKTASPDVEVLGNFLVPVKDENFRDNYSVPTDQIVFHPSNPGT